jgi:hypothetical protein
MCGRGDQFRAYCGKAIGGRDFLFISSALQDQYAIDHESI